MFSTSLDPLKSISDSYTFNVGEALSSNLLYTVFTSSNFFIILFRNYDSFFTFFSGVTAFTGEKWEIEGNCAM